MVNLLDTCLRVDVYSNFFNGQEVGYVVTNRRNFKINNLVNHDRGFTGYKMVGKIDSISKQI